MADIVDSAIGDMEKEFGFASGSHSVIYSNARNDINYNILIYPEFKA